MKRSQNGVMNNMPKNKLKQSFLKLKSFDEYMEKLPEFIGLEIDHELFRKEMELMENEPSYTHRKKEQLRLKRKREIVKEYKEQMAALCEDVISYGPYIELDNVDDTFVNIVYLYPEGKREDINHAIAMRSASSIEIEGNICYAVFPAKAYEAIDLLLFPVKNFFARYDFLKIEQDAAASFLLRLNRIFQIEYLMWKVNYLIPQYRSLRSVENVKLRDILKAHHELIQYKRDEIYEHLIEDGETHARWISEQKAYAIVKKHYPKAVFQYQPKWLCGQRLDIFIPENNSGIEYQGKQHTEAVEFFGGEEGLRDNRIRDRKKNYLCRTHGVKLIYWNYDEPLTEAFFECQLVPMIEGEINVSNPSKK